MKNVKFWVFGLSFLAGMAIAAPKTKMQVAKHVSPMPNLMMLVHMNAAELALDDEQLASVQEWKQTHQAQVQFLMSDILETEQALHDATLEGLDKAEKDELRDDLLASRRELIDIKHRCVTNLQTTLDDEQWQQLMTVRAKMMRAVASNNKGGNEIQAFLRVSPMPKLMAIILMHNQELALDASQSKALENWRLKNMNHWAGLFDDVLTHEKRITQSAINMESAAELMTDFERMAEKRHQMAKMSLACRDHMKQVLNAQQWQKVVNLFEGYRT